MAIVYSYPIAAPEAQDLLVGTEMAEQGGEGTPKTRTFTIGSIVDLVTPALDLKANIASPTFTGTVTAPIINSETIYSETTDGISIQGVSTNSVGVLGTSVNDAGVQGVSTNSVGVVALSQTQPAIIAQSDTNSGIVASSNSGKGIEVTTGGSVIFEGNMGLTSDGLLINSQASSTGRPITLYKDGVEKLSVNQEGELSVVKIPEGGSGEYLMANGTVSTMPTLQQITDSGNTTADTIFVNKETGSGSTGIVVNTINNIGMAITSEAEVCLQLNPLESTGLMITSGDATGIQIALDAGLGIGINTAEGTGISITANDGNAIYAASDSYTGIVVSSNNGDGMNITSNQTGLYVNSLNGIVVGNGGVIISGNVSDDQGYQLYLTSNSAAKPSTNTWTIASDERVKTNINPYAKGLETILAINPVTYDYNGKAGFDPTSTGNIGVIAQDVLNIIPESINTYQAKLNEEDEEKTELYNFDSHALTFILINAIKQLNAEIELLKSK